MNNLDIMDRATSFTTGAYMRAYYHEVQESKITYLELEQLALDYSANALQKVMYASDGMCNDYTRQGNLRYEMASIGADGIKNELLKNIVNVAIYHREKDTRASNELGDRFRPGMSDDQKAVIIFNNLVNYGVEKGYEILNDSEILNSACRIFAYYRREGKKEVLDNIAQTNNVAMYVNNELDTYYARYGKREGYGNHSYGIK